MGMVDKGADVSWLSQYPHEREVLWPPLMGIECLGTKVQGGALVVSARLSLNQMALTLEQVTSKRQKVVCDLCVQLEKELEFDLKGASWAPLVTATEGKAATEAGWLLRSWLRQVDGKPSAAYNNDAELGAAINEAVLAARVVKSWPSALVSLCHLAASGTMAGKATTGRMGTATAPARGAAAAADASPQVEAVASTLEVGAIDEREPAVVAELRKLLLSTASLSLRGSNLGGAGNAAASALLCCSDAIRSLDLSQNRLESEAEMVGGAIGLAKALARNQSLTQLSIAANDMSPQSGDALVAALKANRALRDISIANNRFDAGVRERLHRVIKSNPLLASSAALHEFPIEDQLEGLRTKWAERRLAFDESGQRGLGRDQTEALMAELDEDLIAITGKQDSLYIGPFREVMREWQTKLSTCVAVLTQWLAEQKLIRYLGSIFASEELSRQLVESKQFHRASQRWDTLLMKARATGFVVECCFGDERLRVELTELHAELEICHKGILSYLELKKRAMPRFYFISQSDLMLICSVGREPHRVLQHVSKFTDNIRGVHWQRADESGAETSMAVGCHSPEGEDFYYPEAHLCTGALDEWLPGWLEHQAKQLHTAMKVSLEEWGGKTREERLEQIDQTLQTSNHIVWTADTSAALERRQRGDSDAVAEGLQSIIDGLDFLGAHTRKDLSKIIRKRCTALVTVSVHQRDIVHDLSCSDATEDSFEWTGQFRAMWDESRDNCVILQGSCEVAHKHEYIGCPGRLVVTPLTDRCYLTISTALRLVHGVAPMGPAGTGKTETTKDFARNGTSAGIGSSTSGSLPKAPCLCLNMPPPR